LWSFGKPKGWGGPWWSTPIVAGEPSDPYLMTGFDNKVLHLFHEAERAVNFRIEVDPLGDGSWQLYQTITVTAGAYQHHEFPAGFSAHWLRLVADRDCVATAHLHYS
jgi:hypothetical protein